MITTLEELEKRQKELVQKNKKETNKRKKQL